jgi:hypothetical protein
MKMTMKPTKFNALTIVAVLAFSLATPARATETPSPEKVREEQAYTLGSAAYVWGFTMNELYRARSIQLAKPGIVVNKFDHFRVLMTPELARKAGVVRSNSPPVKVFIMWLKQQTTNQASIHS